MDAVTTSILKQHIYKDKTLVPKDISGHWKYNISIDLVKTGNVTRQLSNFQELTKPRELCYCKEIASKALLSLKN